MMQRNYYLKADGSFEQAHTYADVSRLARRLVERDVLNIAAKAWETFSVNNPYAIKGAPTIAWATYALETARHETSFAWNEVDVEPSGFTSRGLCQISDGHRFDGGAYVKDEDEVTPYCSAKIDLMDPYENIWLMLAKANAHARVILNALKMSTVTDTKPDLFSFLALAHNEGLGTFDPTSKGALGTLARHPERGLSWSAYKLGNVACRVHGSQPDEWYSPCEDGKCSDYIRRIGHYGDDCATGAR